MNPVELMCDHGRRRKLSPRTYEYGFCGSPRDCQCHASAVYERAKARDFTSTPQFLEKRKATWKAKYGVDNPVKTPLHRERASERMRGKKLVTCSLETGFHQVMTRVATVAVPLFDISDYNGTPRTHVYPWRCVTCGTEFKSHLDYGTTPKCPTCWPANVSIDEMTIRQLIIDMGVTVMANTRRVIPPFELDIFIPQLNLGVEFNGNFWHSTAKRRPRYHVDKMLKASGKGIKLIQVFEYEWARRRAAVITQLTNWITPQLSMLTVDTITEVEAQYYIQHHTLTTWAATTHNVAVMSSGQIQALLTFNYNNVVHLVVSHAQHLALLIPHIPHGTTVLVSRDWPTAHLLSDAGFTDITEDLLNHQCHQIRDHTIYDCGYARYRYSVLK